MHDPVTSAARARGAELSERGWTLGVLGLGHVGLPLAESAWLAGLPVVGADPRAERVSAARARALRAPAGCATSFSTDPARLTSADVICICVPTPLGSSGEPELAYVRDAALLVRDLLRPGMVVVLESTSYPGTTEELLLPVLAASGLQLDRDYFVAHSPERISPGEAECVRDIPRLVGGCSPSSTHVAVAAYRRLAREVVPVSSAAVAEMAKLVENTYRAVNIALVNELAQIAHALGLDIWEVLDAASTKPFGFQRFEPGPGVGGHCIPLDPAYLSWRARSRGLRSTLIEAAERANERMPSYVTERVQSALARRGVQLSAARVLGVGVAYKANVADARESASVHVLRLLAAAGARVEVWDPVVGDAAIAELGLAPAADPARGWRRSRYDAAVVLTDHDAIDLSAVAGVADVVFDARDAYRRRRLEAAHLERL